MPFAASSLSAARPLLRRGVAVTQHCQRRSAQVINIHSRFFQTRVEPRVIAKYREKLEEKQKREGVASFEELKEVYKDKIAAVRKDAANAPEVDAVLDAVSPTGSSEPAPTLTQPPPPAPSPIAAAAKKVTTPPGVKTLASYVDPEKLAIHSNPQEIEMIWRARFVNDPTSLCASVPAETYKRMSTLARKHPMFLLPLPREGQGVELHLLQWTFPTKDSATVIFTTLADYKLRGEYAQPHTTLTHHLELMNSHKVVLAQGQVVPDRGVKVQEAQLLLVALQKFYGGIEGPQQERRRELLEQFSSGDEAFSVDALIEEMEKTV